MKDIDGQAYDVADLAKRNIHITNITISNHDTLYIMIKFQWRDPRNNAVRWTESFLEVPANSTTTNIFGKVKGIVSRVRQNIEEQDYGR